MCNVLLIWIVFYELGKMVSKTYCVENPIMSKVKCMGKYEDRDVLNMQIFWFYSYSRNNMVKTILLIVEKQTRHA